MDGPSVVHAALESPGRISTAARPRFGASSPLDCLGEIEVGGETALVVWPQLGDAVAVDFKRDGHRYALVTGLSSATPALEVQPLTGRRIDRECESIVLAAVRAIWASHRAAS